MARDGSTEEAARARIASQMPLAEKAQRADYVIDNSGAARRRPRACARSIAPSSRTCASSRRGGEPASQRARRSRARRCTGRPRAAAPARSASTSCATGGGGPHRGPGGAHRARPGRRDRARARARSPRRSPRAAGRLVALEIDAELAATAPGAVRRARRTWSPPGGRARVRLRGAARAAPDPGGRVLVVGNLPYSVGKPILAALVEAARGDRRDGPDAPAEVAERVAAAARRARPTARSRC